MTITIKQNFMLPGSKFGSTAFTPAGEVVFVRSDYCKCRGGCGCLLAVKEFRIHKGLCVACRKANQGGH